MAQSAEKLDNLERARVLDIMFWAGDLGTRLRRGSRRPVSIPVRICVEEAGGTWEEEATTRQISRYGALIECLHPIAVGRTFVLIRPDTGQQARARVAWRQPQSGTGQKVGIEFLDQENFWNLE